MNLTAHGTRSGALRHLNLPLLDLIKTIDVCVSRSALAHQSQLVGCTGPGKASVNHSESTILIGRANGLGFTRPLILASLRGTGEAMPNAS